MIGMREEWDFVLHTANLYERMGCDVLALDLVRSWEFLLTPPPKAIPGRPPLSPSLPRSSFQANGPNQASNEFAFDPRKLLRRRSSLVVADLPVRETVRSALEEYDGTVEEDEEDGEEEESEEGEGEESDEEEEEPAKSASKKPPPTQFQEPDANSLLDAFGF